MLSRHTPIKIQSVLDPLVNISFLKTQRRYLTMPTKSTGDGRRAVPLWLNGEPQLPRNATLFPVHCAMSGFIVHYAVSATIADAEAACEASWSAFQSWKLSSPSHRRNILNGVADAFERRKDELVEVQFTETSCDEAWAANNVMISINYLREIAACVSSIMGQIPMNDKPETLSLVFKEPVGVVLTIPPWNAALVLATRALASAIGAGCTCVLKASELSPLTHQTILESFEEAGLPKGCINQVQVAREDAAQVTEALIANQRVRKVGIYRQCSRRSDHRQCRGQASQASAYGARRQMSSNCP